MRHSAQHRLGWKDAQHHPEMNRGTARKKRAFYIPLKSKSMRLMEGTGCKGHSYDGQIKQHHVGAHRLKWKEWDAEGINRTETNRSLETSIKISTHEAQGALVGFVCFSLTSCVVEIIQVGEYFGDKSLNWIRVHEWVCFTDTAEDGCSHYHIIAVRSQHKCQLSSVLLLALRKWAFQVFSRMSHEPKRRDPATKNINVLT